MLLKMCHVQVIGARSQLDRTIAVLHRLGVLHLGQAARSRLLKSLGPDEATRRLQEDLSFLAARIDSLLGVLPASEQKTAAGWNPDRDSREMERQLNSELDRIAPPIHDLARERDRLQAEALSLPRYEVTLKKLVPLAVEIRTMDGFDTAALLIDKPYREVLDLIRVEVEHRTHSECEVVARDGRDTLERELVLHQ